MRRVAVSTASVLLLANACVGIPTFSASSASPEAGTLDGGESSPDAAIADGGTIPVDGFASDGSINHFRMFVTSGTARGNFAADADAFTTASTLCQSFAGDAGLGGKWGALLWASLDASPASRIPSPTGGWYQVTDSGAPGKLILSSLATNTNPQNPILTEKGEVPSVNVNVWTGGTLTAALLNCSDWSNAAALGATGHAADQVLWNTNGDMECTNPARLYCLELPLQ